MASRVREVLVTVAASVLVAGAVTGVVLPVLPEAWRGPVVPWTILLGSIAVVAAVRRHKGASR